MADSAFGYSVCGLPILAHTFGRVGPKVLVLGGVHGDETEGVVLASSLVGMCLDHFPLQIQLTVVPSFNIDGVLARSRTNANGVDLNRNLPTNDWSPMIATPRYHPGLTANSEPENQALTQWLITNHPQLIVSCHSWKPMINVNGDCHREAEVMALWTKCAIEESVGYPTPGCLGTYCGLERDMPTITLEIQRGLHPQAVIKIWLTALWEALKQSEKRGITH